MHLPIKDLNRCLSHRQDSRILLQQSYVRM